MLRSLELTIDHQRALKDHCAEVGIEYLCTPYDRPSVDLLEAVGIDAYKIASTDTNNLPFLRYIASKGRPVILSTGMAGMAEVEQAVAALTGDISVDVLILHCTSEYPAPIDEANLRAMATLRLATGCPVGFSDHTEGISASQWAVALGAVALEKHFTMDRSLPGPDHRASLEPAELRQYVDMIRQVEAALGDGIKRPSPSEVKNKIPMRKSVVAARALAAGHVLGEADLTCKRPGDGLAPDWMDRLIGSRLATDLQEDEQVMMSSSAWRDAPK
jgi:sialic acid synthase SpsE